MEDISRLFSFLALVFLLLGLIFNLVPNLPRIPGDLYINKLGFKIYIPFASVIVISVLISLFFNFFKK